MVRKSLRSPRENSYYKNNKVGEDDDTHFSIMTSDFATKAAVTNNATPQATTDAQKEYDDFVSGLDDRQKNAIKVLDTWFQLKSSCVNQMAEMEAGNDALRDAVSRSKSARAPATNLTEKELGLLLGTGSNSRLALVRDDQGSVVIDADLSALGPYLTILGGMEKGEALVGADYRNNPEFWKVT